MVIFLICFVLLQRQFILWLTTQDPEKRPTCREVMQSSYLKDDVHCVASNFRPDRSHVANNDNLK